MRFRLLAILIAIFFYSQVGSTSAQQAGTSTPTTQSQAATLLSQSAAALTGRLALQDVTITGSAERIAGGDDDTGSVTYRAIAGSSRLDLSFASGTASEVRTTTASGVTGSWIGSDGASHPMAGHNVMTDVGWFPAFTVKGILSSANSMLSYIGLETRGNSSLIHVTSWQQIPSVSVDAAALTQHLSQMDLYLDPATFLPSIVAYNIHPDDNALVDIPIEIHFSDYRSVNGILVPFHVQKFLNNGLYLDFTFQNAVINSGLTASSFAN